MNDVDWLDDVQQSPRHLPRRLQVLSTLLQDEEGRAIQTRDDWHRRREVLRRQWDNYLGQLNVDRAAPPAFDVLEEDRLAGVMRQRIRYEVEPGCPIEAYLLRPVALQGAAPGVVVFHSTVPYTIRQPAGLEGASEKAFGLELARRGFVAICPRCSLWPEKPRRFFRWHAHQTIRKLRIRHRNAKGMAKLTHDAQVALDLLASLPGVDPQRLGAVGHSLGAKEVLYLAAFDERVRAAVSSEGGIGRRLSNWSAPWYLGRNFSRANSRREHHELLALVAPRAFLLIGGDAADGDSSWPFVTAALPVYQLYDRRPRLGFFNHRQGHTVPPEAEQRIYEWLETYLSPSP
ncbi:MAG: dienelactone hydrolase family protein [Pirellulaceae bacterium]